MIGTYSRPLIVRKIYLLSALLVFGSIWLALYRLALAAGVPAALPVLGRTLGRFLEHLGPSFVKMGQLLSTREDLLPVELILPLARLQDQGDAVPWHVIQRLVELELGGPVASVFQEFAEVPLATGSIAQVHAAKLSTGRLVVVKVRRPSVSSRIDSDVRAVLQFANLLHRLPWVRGFPVEAALGKVCNALLMQTDFEAEAKVHARFHGNLFQLARIPVLYPEYCTPGLLVMERISGLVKMTDDRLSDESRERAITDALRILYQMIFCDGLIHCDLHPGNVFCGTDGRPVLLDFGFWAELENEDRLAFARFFLCVTVGDGAGAAEVIRSTALECSDSFDSRVFEAQITELVDRSARASAEGFLVSDFLGALFSIQRKNGLLGSPAFTMAALSLLALEGTARHLFPSLDFQREAVPYLISALNSPA